MSKALRAIGISIGWAGLLIGTATAQTPPSNVRLAAPQEIVLYVHASLTNTDFVELLVCELSRVIAAPVSTQKLPLPLGADLLASPTQFDTAKLAGRLYQLTANDGGERTFKFLLLPYDLRGGPYAYVFGSSFGRPHNSGVISTARLTPGEGISRKQAANLVMLRTYKMILRYIAQLSGYTAANGCVLAFPRSVDELDQKSADFCDADRAILVQAGVLKSKPSGGCVPVAMNEPARRIASML